MYLTVPVCHAHRGILESNRETHVISELSVPETQKIWISVGDISMHSHNFTINAVCNVLALVRLNEISLIRPYYGAL